MAGYSRKHKFVKKVSQHSNIRQDVVELIVDSMIDIMIEEIVNTGRFSFLGLFHIKAKEWKGYSFGNDKEQKVDNHQRLTVSLSKHLKELWKIRFDKFDGEENVIDRNNWRDVYKTYGLKPRKKSNHVKPLKNSSPVNETLVEAKDKDEEIKVFNPFLDDDDEEY